MNDEEKQRIVDSAMKAFAPAAKSADQQAHDEIMAKARAVTEEIRRTITPMVQGTIYDPKAVARKVGTMYLEAFHKWDRDELLYLTTHLHAEIFLTTL